MAVNVASKAMIFDMDGVIFDSERAVYEGWLELAEKYHITDIETVYAKCIGVNSKITRRIFLEYYGEDFPYDKYKAEQSSNYHAKYDGGHLPLKPGIKELLIALKGNGYKTAVASSTRTALVEQQIKENGLGEYFDVIVGGDMVEKSKPEPDIFQKAAKLLGVSCKQCYVIEDSYNGIRGADAAGMIAIMVPDMLEPDDEMRQKARYIFKDLHEVKKFLMI
jgi:HAD superfamily hydrolase (TIGR01509 family)